MELKKEPSVFHVNNDELEQTANISQHYLKYNKASQKKPYYGKWKVSVNAGMGNAKTLLTNGEWASSLVVQSRPDEFDVWFKTSDQAFDTLQKAWS